MIRIVVADDQRLVRKCLSEFLNSMTNVQVVAEAGDGEEAVRMARAHRPDIVLMDVIMSGMGGFEATQRILRQAESTRVIALTTCIDAPIPAQMMKAGAAGYLTKNIDAAELEEAIRKVYLGKRYVCHEVAQQLANYAYEENLDSPFGTLSNREMQIMMMVVGCQKVSEISSNLHLSPKTVNSYRYRIFDKLKVGSDVELVLLAVKHGIAPAGPKPAIRAAQHDALSAAEVAS